MENKMLIEGDEHEIERELPNFNEDMYFLY